MTKRKILLIIFLFFIVSFATIKFTRSSFNDEEKTLGNSIQVGTWGTTITPTPTEVPPGAITPTPSPVLLQKTIYLNNLGADIDNQYGYNHDYSNAAVNNVSFTYATPIAQKLSGQLQASGLKPYATYQVKLSGTPVCEDSLNGNDTTNEYIGYKGRWTCVSSNCSGQSVEARNRTDAQYETNKIKDDSDPTKEGLAGYLVFDYITADGSGSASKTIETANSYHVLRCGGGTCNTNVDSFLYFPDASHNSVAFCPEDKVNGELERLTCGGLTLSIGNYSLTMSLTEESFHQGDWAVVLFGDIVFEIQ